MTWEEFIKKVMTVLNLVKDDIILDYSNTKISYTICGNYYEYTKEQYNTFKDSLKDIKLDSLSVETNDTYEAILYNLKGKTNSLAKFDILNRNDGKEYNISYRLGDASNEILYCILKEIDVDKFCWEHYINFNNYKYTDGLELFTILKLFLGNPYTITLYNKIEMDTSKKIKCINSFLFQCAYNFFEYMHIAKSLYDFLGSGTGYKSTVLRSLKYNVDNVIYIPYLIDQYQLASSSMDPVFQFIAYYHIMEYFFDIDYHKDLRNSLKETINKSCDATIKEENIEELLQILIKKYNIKRGFGEKDKLKLTLTKHVTINNVCESIELNNKKLINHYKSNVVTFSKGNKVNLKGDKDKNKDKDKDKDKDIFNDLADRIYKTRNAIVHSKANNEGEEESNVYKPFEHEEALKKEIPLMRAIAEQVIIKTAEEI